MPPLSCEGGSTRARGRALYKGRGCLLLNPPDELVAQGLEIGSVPFSGDPVVAVVSEYDSVPVVLVCEAAGGGEFLEAEDSCVLEAFRLWV